jgi:hypothetical protein
MENTWVGPLIAVTLVVFVASACETKHRDFGGASGAGGENPAGKSGSGPDGRGGNQTRAGAGGDDFVGGGSAAEAGADGGSCQPVDYNACGGCAELVAAPGTACGECGKYECAADKESVTCEDVGKNECGGCGVLAMAPNSSCGDCGSWECTADKTDVKCSGLNANACGGCGALANAPGLPCGQCGTFECSVDKASTACNDPGKNACGGCTALTGTLNAACGPCSVTACSADKNSLDCNSQCTAAQVCVSGLNQCKTPDCSAANSCGMSDGAGSTCINAKGHCPAKPNATGSCSGSSCAYACSTKALSCSTSAEPACGSWNFESNSVGFEGWKLKNTSNADSGGLYYAAPPGGNGFGAHSLALNVDASAAVNASFITITVEFCPGGALATGIQGAFHAQVWFKPTDGKGGLGGPGYSYIDNGSVSGPDVNCPPGAWFDVPSNNVSGTSIKMVELTIGGIEGHKGVLYFDNMYFE